MGWSSRQTAGSSRSLCTPTGRRASGGIRSGRRWRQRLLPRSRNRRRPPGRFPGLAGSRRPPRLTRPRRRAPRPPATRLRRFRKGPIPGDTFRGDDKRCEGVGMKIRVCAVFAFLIVASAAVAGNRPADTRRPGDAAGGRGNGSPILLLAQGAQSSPVPEAPPVTEPAPSSPAPQDTPVAEPAGPSPGAETQPVAEGAVASPPPETPPAAEPAPPPPAPRGGRPRGGRRGPPGPGKTRRVRGNRRWRPPRARPGNRSRKRASPG